VASWRCRRKQRLAELRAFAGWVERSEATPVNMRIRNSNFFFRTLSKMDLSYSNEACHVEGIGQTR
jgi:hypothetical protein